MIRPPIEECAKAATVRWPSLCRASSPFPWPAQPIRGCLHERPAPTDIALRSSASYRSAFVSDALMISGAAGAFTVISSDAVIMTVRRMFFAWKKAHKFAASIL
jgi:hypothetical protein